LNSAFESSNIKEIELPDCLTILENNCFKNCKYLERVKFGDCSITAIPDYCFYNCTALTEINIPSSVNLIGEYAFAFCKSLRTLNLKETSLSTIESYAFSSCGVTSFDFPSTLNPLYDNAFEQCSLEAINFSGTCVLEIPKSCFSECKNLLTVILSNTTTKIDVLAFFGCSS